MKIKAIKKAKNVFSAGILVLDGFKYSKAVQYIKNKEKAGTHKKLYKNIMRVSPFSNRIEKFFEDDLTTRKILFQHKDFFLDEKTNNSIEVSSVIHIVYMRNLSDNTEYFDFYKEICENSDSGRTKAFFCKDAVIDEQARNSALNIVNTVRLEFAEAEYFDFSFLVLKNEAYLLKIDTDVSVEYLQICAEEIIYALKKRSEIYKKTSLGEKAEIIKKYLFAYYAKKKGFVDFMYKNWRNGLKDDRKTYKASYTDRKWAHKKGFYSYRIEQYGITKDNYKEFLSDYDYKRLRPLNGQYQKWLWDKITTYFIMKPFKEYIPEYYYRIIHTEYGNLIITFDEIDSCKRKSFEDIAELIKLKKKLVLKLAVGSHGKGFYKLEYDADNKIYYVNNERKKEEDIRDIIETLEYDYILTEYIEMHRDLKKIYSNVACTIRVMTINDGSSKDCVKYAFYRIGTSKTGHTDNLDSGGLVAKVDVKTGRYYGAELLRNHVFYPCTAHPDTGTEINGVLPFWQQIKEEISNICAYLSQLEYLGFDVVITDIGFKILEINTHQDMHKFYEYPDDVKEYFFKKLKEKNNR